jgi:hypothetical protein
LIMGPGAVDKRLGPLGPLLDSAKKMILLEAHRTIHFATGQHPGPGAIKGMIDRLKDSGEYPDGFLRREIDACMEERRKLSEVDQ